MCFDFRNVIFYYGTGVSIGVLASLLIAVYVLSRFVPFKVITFNIQCKICTGSG